MAEMAAKREREKQRFAELEADVTGRGAQTVSRARWAQAPEQTSLPCMEPCCAAA